MVGNMQEKQVRDKLVRKIRVAHIITESWFIGGAQRNTLLTISGSNRQIFDITLLSGPGQPEVSLLDEVSRLGFDTYVVQHLVREVNPMQEILALTEIIRIFRRQNFQIVHTHSIKAGILGRIAARICGVPIIIHTVHGLPIDERTSNFYRKLIFFIKRQAAKLSDAIIVVGDQLRQTLLDERVCNSEKIYVTRVGTDFERFTNLCFDANIKKKELGLSQENRIICNVGAFTEFKGQDILIEAFSLVKQQLRGEKLALLLVGYEREFAPVIRKQIENLGLQDSVIVAGPRLDVPELLHISEIYVQASYREGVSRALIEAMYSRKPVVATAVGGTSELIEDEKTGLMVDAGDPISMANAIRRLLTDKQLAANLAENAHKKVNPEYSAQNMVKQIEEIYLKILRQKKLG